MWFETEWIKLPCKVEPLDSYWKKYSFTDENMFTATTAKTRKRDRPYAVGQPRRRHDKTPTHTINVQSLVASVDESQVVDSTPVWYLPILVSWSPRAIKLHTLRFSADLVRT